MTCGPGGVLLLAFGGPETLADVPGFLRSLLGREPPPAVLGAVRERYEAVGGGSPLPAVTRVQAAALAAELARRGWAAAVRVGMRYARPSVGEAVRSLAEAGVARVVALPLSPFRAGVSTEAYHAETSRAWEEAGRPFALVRARPWHDHRGFLDALWERLEEGLQGVPVACRESVPVVFTAHSLPVAEAAAHPYAADFEATAGALAARLGGRPWRLAYQSRGMTGGEWLGPEVEEVLGELAAAGAPGVVLQPLGFVADHMETVYDNDVLHRRRAEELGLLFVRCRCLNDSPTFIGALADVVGEALGEEGGAGAAGGDRPRPR